MFKRVCRDCPISGCGAKYLVKLSNHLTDVHQLDHIRRRKFLQEAKLQPKVKVLIYHNTEKSKDSRVCSPSKTTPSSQQEENGIVYHVSTPRKVMDLLKTRTGGVGNRKVMDLLKTRTGGIGKATKTSKPRKTTAHSSPQWLTL